MKRYIFTLLIMIYINTYLTSIDFQIEKVNEFSLANPFISANISKNNIMDYPYLFTLLARFSGVML